jgi:hypothetical protein
MYCQTLPLTAPGFQEQCEVSKSHWKDYNYPAAVRLFLGGGSRAFERNGPLLFPSSSGGGGREEEGRRHDLFGGGGRLLEAH